MVTAAYSSGKPSFGVGAGNVQVIIDRDIDYHEAAAKVIAGRKFDNGIICSGEQSIIAPKSEYEDIIEAFKKEGAHYIEDQEEVEKFRNILFEDPSIKTGFLNPCPTDPTYIFKSNTSLWRNGDITFNAHITNPLLLFDPQVMALINSVSFFRSSSIIQTSFFLCFVLFKNVTVYVDSSS